MNTKTMVIVAAAGVAAWLLLSRRSNSTATANSAPGSSRSALISSGIAAGSKILGTLFATGGGSPSKVGGTGQPTYVTSSDQISGSKVVGNGFVTSLEDA